MKTISEIRRANLERLLKEGVTQADLARLMNRSPKQVSGWFGKGSARNMSDKLARELEEKVPKEEGWMDNPPQPSQDLQLDIPKLSEALVSLDKALKAAHLTYDAAYVGKALAVAYYERLKHPEKLDKTALRMYDSIVEKDLRGVLSEEGIGSRKAEEGGESRLSQATPGFAQARNR